LLLADVSGVKDNPAIRKSSRSMQGFEFSMAGVPDPKTAQGRGLRVQNMNLRGHEGHAHRFDHLRFSIFVS